ncbi:MAG: hypothetical protein IJA91_01255 [Clostridia bacterium]|nr:hypothetical protein [Clostridia bacterium]
MKNKSVISICLCCVLAFTVISCSTQPDAPADSTAEQTNTVPGETTAVEIETQPIPKPEHVTLIDGTLSTDQYTLTADGAGYYIEFLEEYEASDEDKLACQLGEIYFDSMADLATGFRENKLDDYQRIILQAAFTKTEKGFQICDLNHLYDAALPEGAYVSSVALHSTTYDFFVRGELFKSGSISYVDDWTVSKDRMYDWSKGTTVTREEESTFDGVPCRIVEYYNSTQTYRDIFIETEKDGKTVYMVLRYLLEDQRPFPERVADTAPWNVRMYCEDNGVFYDVSLKELTETPTYEWLSSFGLTPYVPSANDNLATE